MEPLFFGEASQPLYGVYHGSARIRPRPEGVVLFYPAGQEYMRIHRAYRWLADQLADHGFHVLRFDYTGQGDSWGAFADASMARWQQDGARAIEELEAISGCERVALVGTRLGATIAAAHSDHPLVNRLVLWEPRTPGSALVSEVDDQIASGDWPLANFREADGTTHLNGFAFSSLMMNEIGSSEISAQALAQVKGVLTITSVEGLDFSSLLNPARDFGVAVDERYAPGPTDWNRVDGIGGVFLPQRILHDICEWIDGEAP